MFLRFLPWRYLIKRAARAYGIIDPATVLARLRQFSQPSEVQEPIELLRAGIIFQARGLINTRAIQYNLDWVWPHWVERQFNPADLSFIPRAFSATHINLTHRNWTAVGLPDLPLYPLVDPRGLFTPLYDGWSIDFWIVPEDGEPLVPSRLESVDQRYEFEPSLAVKTVSELDNMRLETVIDLVMENNQPEARVRVRGLSGKPARLCVSVRPYNPEGVQFIEKMAYAPNNGSILIDDLTSVFFDPLPDAVKFSDYDMGDVFNEMDNPENPADMVNCRVGLATGAAIYGLEPNLETEVRLRVPMGDELRREFPKASPASVSWVEAKKDAAEIIVPDEQFKYIYQSAKHALLLLTAYDVFPGPFGYRRFWFRDACLMLNALMGIGMMERSRRLLDQFPGRQSRNGYFHSQEGEWDSNGQVLWIMDRFALLTGEPLPDTWLDAVMKGAEWITGKRIKDNEDALLEGLLPAGFSAEHLGPNDYYYWDNFWGLAGLYGAARQAGLAGREKDRERLAGMARDYFKTIAKNIENAPEHKRKGTLPAAPKRRMDAGAVGSMVADWPLKLFPAGDPTIKKTIEYLLENSFHRGGFFQDMIHSGINIYLTLDLAQTLLRYGDERYQELIETCIELASPTGQWPEAVHPFSGGGCMGDGQHGWAAAEWLLMTRSLFVREEEDTLIIGSGIFPKWLEAKQPISFGPTPTPYGPVSVFLNPDADEIKIHVEADWRGVPPRLEARVRGFEPKSMPADGTPVILKRMDP